MVKKCLGSILLPEKHSLLYLSMLLCRELFTWNKNRRHGGEGEISNSVCWRLAGCNSTRAGSFESHTQEAFGQKHNRNRFSFAPWIKKVIPLTQNIFHFYRVPPKSDKSPFTLPRKHTHHLSRPSGCPSSPQEETASTHTVPSLKETESLATGHETELIN